MANYPRVILRHSKIAPIKRFHPWIFSGAIVKVDPEAVEGSFVDVYSDRGEFLAFGHYNPGNIAVKILSFSPVDDPDELFLDRFRSAYVRRQRSGLIDNPLTNCYRLVNAEGDGLPGLIVDMYDGTAVIQTHALALHEKRETIVSCLRSLYGDGLKAVYDKSASVMVKTSLKTENEYLFGSTPSDLVLESGYRFYVDLERGQKTGFFLDQRDNRALLTKYVKDKRVLNTFCYSGGFSVYAIGGGASLVHSVDSSKGAIELTEKNIALNNPDNIPHAAYTEDVFTFLKDSDGDYDTIVLDPPAFAKSLNARHRAVMAYKRLNYQALNKIKPNGILFTFSCSQVVGEEHFLGAVTAAAIESGRGIKLLARLGQPADHPTDIFHPEGSYLKGLVLGVD